MANGVAAYAFDTHNFVKRLTAAGLSLEVAETLADEQSRLVEKITSNVASKEELKEHKSVLKDYKSDMKEDFKRLEDRIDAKLENLSLKLIVRLGGVMVAVLSVFKLLSNFFGK